MFSLENVIKFFSLDYFYCHLISPIRFNLGNPIFSTALTAKVDYASKYVSKEQIELLLLRILLELKLWQMACFNFCPRLDLNFFTEKNQQDQVKSRKICHNVTTHIWSMATETCTLIRDFCTLSKVYFQLKQFLKQQLFE